MSSQGTPEQIPVNITTPKRGLRGMFDILSIRNFRLYFLGLITLTFAGQLQLPAQSWLAYELTHSPLKLTLVAAMQAIPMIVFSIYSGVFIDRIQKRSILFSRPELFDVYRHYYCRADRHRPYTILAPPDFVVPERHRYLF